MKLAPGIYAMRGATAYELQVWRIVMRWTHLRGQYWRWRPWRRVSIMYYSKEN